MQRLVLTTLGSRSARKALLSRIESGVGTLGHTSTLDHEEEIHLHSNVRARFLLPSYFEYAIRADGSVGIDRVELGSHFTPLRVTVEPIPGRHPHPTQTQLDEIVYKFRRAFIEAQ